MTVILRSEQFCATFEPERGGLLAQLDWQDGGERIELLYKPAALAPPPVFGGLWPLVPFANRAFGGKLISGDRLWQLPINEPKLDCCLHGFGWLEPWRIDRLGSDEIRMSHEKTAGADPYRYQGEFAVQLMPGCVRATLSVTNTAEQSLPYGIGLHPWFHANYDTTVSLVAAGALKLGSDYRPVAHEPRPDGGPFASGRLVKSAAELMWSLTDWTGEASVTTPSLGLEVRLQVSETLRHPFIWAPASADFVCVEPYSHAAGAPSEAFVSEVTPLRLLGPGESLSGWLDLTPRRIARAADGPSQPAPANRT